MKEIDIEKAKIELSNSVVDIVNKYKIPFGVTELILGDMLRQIVTFKNLEIQKEQSDNKEDEENVQDTK